MPAIARLSGAGGPGLLGDYYAHHEAAVTSSTDHRRAIYAGCAAQLLKDHAADGAEAIFDQALTNGLLAIAEVEVPDKLRGAASAALKNKDKLFRLPSAWTVLTYLEDGAPLSPENGCLTYSGVMIPVAALKEAIKRTQGARHGRHAAGVLTSTDVTALLALDDHPALSAVHGQAADVEWIEGRLADQEELARVALYIADLGDAEVERRAEVATDLHAEGAPGEPWSPLQECPACWQLAVKPTGSDALGYGNTAGRCLVCSYELSEFVATEADHAAEWTHRWADL